MVIMSLKKLSLPLLKATYGSNKNHRIAIRVYNLVEKLMIYLEKLLDKQSEMNFNLYEEILQYIYLFL